METSMQPGFEQTPGEGGGRHSPGVLWSVGLRRVGHNLVTERQRHLGRTRAAGPPDAERPCSRRGSLGLFGLLKEVSEMVCFFSGEIISILVCLG